MGKSDRSMKWFARITAPWEHIETKFKLMREWIDYDSSAIGYHIGSKTKKPHAHIALAMKSELQKQSFDVRMKKLFDVCGVNYSSKPWDGDKKALSYLHHDKKGKVEYFMELSEIELKEIDNLVVVYDEIVTTAKAKSSGRIVDSMLDTIKESGRLWTIREIHRCILVGIRDGKWHPPGYSMLERYIDEIRIKQGSDVDADGVIDAMTAQFMERYERR